MDLTQKTQHSTKTLSLTNIEETAEVVLLKLLNSTSVSEREMHLQALTGLHRVAVIKSVGDRRSEWNALVAAEPTKPAVDRLHELVSTWNDFSLQQEARARDDLLEVDARNYADGQSVAWGKAGHMLKELLQEGGL